MRYTLILAALFMAIVAYPSPRPADIEDLMAEWRESYGQGWWPWGLQAIDVDGDGVPELVITQHNGGSRVLKQTDSGWQWRDVGSSLGGTYRPYVLDFNGDGQPDLLYRDSGQNTAYRNDSGKFVPAGFAYGTDNDPVREITPTFFGSDFLRYGLPGFNEIQYLNPNFTKMPQSVQDYYWAEKKAFGKFCRGWFTEADGLVCFSIYYSYGKGWPQCHHFWKRRNRLVNVAEKLGLPTDGCATVHLQDFNGDGLPELMITGGGYFLSTPTGYLRQPGILSDFLSVRGDWPHWVLVSGDKLIVSNVKGLVTKIFTHLGGGQFGLAETFASWEEGVALGDFNSDGIEDIAVGSGMSIRFIWGK